MSVENKEFWFVEFKSISIRDMGTSFETAFDHHSDLLLDAIKPNMMRCVLFIRNIHK